MSLQKNYISIKQQEAIRKVSLIIKKNLKKNKDISLSDHYYFNSWADNYGKRELIKLMNIKQTLFYKFYLNLKLIFGQSILEIDKYYINDFLDKEKNYKNLIISYCNNEIIRSKKLFDKFFSSFINKSKNTLWLYINTENMTNKIDSKKNLILIYKKKNNYFLNINFYYYFFKNIFLLILNRENKFIRDNLDKTICENLHKILSKYKIKRVIMPFEAQPLQHRILKKIKNFNHNIKTIAYLHAALSQLPTDFIWKENAPDTLMVHGKSQKEILISKLGWKNSTIKVTSSFRFQKKNKDNFINKIYLPYSLNNLDLLIKKFNLLFQLKSLNLSPNFKVQNHPFMFNSGQHKRFEKKLILSMKEFSNNFKTKRKNNVSIFFGGTAAILEVLEYQIEAIHICGEPIFESHSNKIWNSIKVEKLAPNIFKYKILKNNSLIRFGKKNDFLKKFNIYESF